jgi:hypothetical protein
VFTLLPYKGYMKTAECMTDWDLKSQLWTVSNIFRGPRFTEHSMIPGMWKGHIFQLVCYGLSLTWHAQQRGLKGWPDHTRHIAQFRHITDSSSKPPWVGDPWVHRSHRSRLLGRYEGSHYEELFPGTPLKMPTIWPQLDDSDSRGYRLYIDAGDKYLVEKKLYFMPEGLYLGGNREVLEA